MDSLKKIHEAELEVLKDFIKICDENNLRYMMLGGTMLGAVRHKGFIPWDDDIDIGMPRADYERFIEIFMEPNKENLYLNYYKNQCQNTYAYKNIRDIKHWKINEFQVKEISNIAKRNSFIQITTYTST